MKLGLHDNLHRAAKVEGKTPADPERVWENEHKTDPGERLPGRESRRVLKRDK